MELISGHTQIRTISFSKPTEARQQIDNSCILNQAICRQLKIICVPSVFANLINKILYHIQPQERFTASQHYVATILYIYKNSINDFRRNIHILRFTAQAMSALQITSSCKFYPNTCIFVLLLHHTSVSYTHLQQINVIQSEINNIDAQIAKYDELISQKEDELAQLEQQEAEQYQLFCERVRYMEEEGEVSYWAILFNAEDFSDMLDRFMMVEEIMALSLIHI